MNNPAEQQSAATPGEFRAVLTPYRSLSKTGFLVLMAAISTVAVGTGLVFWWQGAWPVLGFCGLDVLLIYWAFRANFAAARISEHVELADHALTVTTVPRRGPPTHTGFNPAWVRVDIRELAGDVCELRLAEGKRTTVIGAFLGDGERRDFARALSRAISSYRAR